MAQPASLDFVQYHNVVGNQRQGADVSAASTDPSTGVKLWDVPVATSKDVEAAVQWANDAFPAWSATPIETRRRLITQFRDAYKANYDGFLDLIIAECGKTRPLAEGEVNEVLALFDHHLNLSIPEEDERLEDDERIIITRHIPVGVVVAICPWNFPLVLSVGKILPALLTGCCIIVKPSPFTPYSALKIVELASSIFPPGVLQAVGGELAGPLLVNHPRVNKIAFTGSSATGKKVLASAAGTVKRVTLELGGNDAAIILPDVDIASVALKIVLGSFIFSGQVCLAIKRVYVHEDIYKDFLRAMMDAVAKLVVGKTRDPRTTLGPMQNAMQYGKVRDLVQDCKDQGYKFALGPPSLDDSAGFYISPSIVDNPPETARIVVEEQFVERVGPIVPVLRWKDEVDVIARANNGVSGLGASIWSSDRAHAERIGRHMQTGSVFINSWAKTTPRGMLSGQKESGLGVEWGTRGYLEYCNAQVTHVFKSASFEGTGASCFECRRAGDVCVLAESRRGGDYSRFRRNDKQKQMQASTTPSSIDGLHPSPTSQDDPDAMAVAHPADSTNKDGDEVPVDPVYAELRNPRDALDILARLAADETASPTVSTHSYPQQNHGKGSGGNSMSMANSPEVDGDAIGILGANNNVAASVCQPMLSDTETLVIGVLGVDTARHLLACYANKYHPFCPLASKSLLEATDLRLIAIEEPFLLTVILTVASKDEPVYRDVHQQCLHYLKRHLVDIIFAAPSTVNVGAVEGLLLLAEWVPYTHFENNSPQTNNVQFPKTLTAVEDHTAWSLIGQAVRHSYLLRLDQASFKGNLHNNTQLENRKRLAWIYRQISVRMGQSFWSRGPSLSTRFTANDFPSLRLQTDAEHNYAMVLQATIELTQLLHNAHDILYSSRERTVHMILRGDYNRYLDDFRTSLSAWKGRWNGLQASPKLDCTLRIVQEYVCLYVNAFSFQAILSRAAKEGQEAASAGHNRKSSSVQPQTQPQQPKSQLQPQTLPQSLFPCGLMASPDGAYVFEAITAARNILAIANKTDPVKHIRYMPFRFYVYTIYAAVFLYKTDVFGAISRTEHEETTHLVRRFISLLNQAAPSSNNEHVGNRYGRLLTRMWISDGGTSTEPFSGLPRTPGGGVSAYPSMNFPNPGPGPGFEGQSMQQKHQDSVPGAFGFADLDSLSVGDMPDFSLFCPDFSALEAEVLDLGVKGLGAASFNNVSYM
ncbi:hypothetical protein SEUCBS140593_001700 [Sporothrix eucalyptigena]|uniref:aldehyde dehydrogenase (NAD(+)) n=1 Tax=Sporothrix eucalyptigena TaxID=1812306 RepID=A0ABP0B0I3_9PEZI